MPSNFVWLKDRNALCNRMDNIGKLTGERNHEAAIAAALELLRDCEARGIASATNYWAVSVVYDNAGPGSLPEALKYILLAVHKDPFSHSIDRSFRIVMDHVRARLLGSDWVESDVDLYERLTNEGLADDDLHLAYCKHLLASDRAVEALQVARAIAMFSPRSVAAWQLVEAAAVACNDMIVATNARMSAQAASIESPEPLTNMACAQA